MKHHHRHSQVNSNHKAIVCALLSQTIWLPIFFHDAQERWSFNQSQINTKDLSQFSPSLTAATGFESSSRILAAKSSQSRSYSQLEKQNTGLLLNPGVATPLTAIRKNLRSSRPSYPSFSTAYMPAPAPSVPAGTVAEQGSKFPIRREFLRSSSNHQNISLAGLTHMYSQSELLGGNLTLRDLTEPAMPPIARAERAQWSRTGDPLAPLPQNWREPMRRALQSLTTTTLNHSGRAKTNDSTPRLDAARLVHVPSAKIRQAKEVPLALQDDGTVDILNRPDDPAVIEEISRWSTKQKPPEKGRIRPAVVYLHPLRLNDQVASPAKVEKSPPKSISAVPSAPVSPTPPTHAMSTPTVSVSAPAQGLAAGSLGSSESIPMSVESSASQAPTTPQAVTASEVQP